MAPTLRVQGTRFTLDGEPRFLLGISYYAALGAEDQLLRHDLDEIRGAGFNWLRVWANWAAFGSPRNVARSVFDEACSSFVSRLDILFSSRRSVF